jgi:hypothetical protein
VSAREKWEHPPSIGYLLDKLRYVPADNLSFLLWSLRNLWSGLWASGRVHYWGPRYDGMEADLQSHSLLEVCARQWQACVRSCLNGLARLPSERYVSVRYETLVTDPAILDRLLSRLDHPDPAAVRRHYRSVVHDHSVGRWRRDLSAAEQQTVNTLLSSTLDRINDPLSRSSR